MKRLVAILLVSCLMLATFGIALADTYVVNTEKDPLNVRDVNDSSIIYGGLRKGTKINVTRTDKFWAYITYNGHAAKVYKAYLKPASASTSHHSSSKPKAETPAKPVERTPADITEASMIYVVKPNVEGTINIYAIKSTSSEPIGTARAGDAFFVRNVGKTWTRIVYEGAYAFVRTKYITRFALNLPDEGATYRVSVGDGYTVNVRENASKEAKIVARIPNGAYLKVTNSEGDWSHVLYSTAGEGFVMTKFIVEEEFN